MFDVLVREAAARFGLGDKALPLLQILLHYLAGEDGRGLAAFLEKFKVAGLGPVIQSWLGGGPSARPISNGELESVLGGSDGLISVLVDRLGVEREGATSALAYYLPAIVGKLTPGGSVPTRIPQEITTFAAQGKYLIDAAATTASARAGGGGFMKWLPWVLMTIAILLAVGFWGAKRDVMRSAASSAGSAATQQAPAEAGSGPESDGSAAQPTAPQQSSTGDGAAIQTPGGADATAAGSAAGAKTN